MHKIGLRGRLPQFIENFLENITFQVKVAQTRWRTYNQEMGVPQGGILSSTLFAIKVNEIWNTVPNDPNFYASIYVEDTQVGYTHTDLNGISNRLQKFTNKMTKWADSNEFKLAADKAKAVHFCKVADSHSNPPSS